MIHHIFEMTEAKEGFGIVSHNSKLMKKLDKNKALFTGDFEACMEQKKKFVANPKLLDAIYEAREKAEQKEISKLLKKHK